MEIKMKKFVKSIDKGQGKYKIYALFTNDENEKTTDELVYVGITSETLGARLSNHKYERKISNLSIALITNTDNKEDESKWINYFSNMGIKLWNKISGISKKEKPIKEKTDIKKYRKQYYELNKEKIKAYQKSRSKDYYENNKEKLKEYSKNYYKSKMI